MVKKDNVISIPSIDAALVIAGYYGQVDVNIQYITDKVETVVGIKGNSHPIQRCWWCRKVIKTKTYGIPITYRPPDLFGVVGQFHSLRCTKAYIDECNTSSLEYKDVNTLFTLYVYKETGTMTAILPAPSWKMRREYGGHMSDEEYDDTAPTYQLATMAKSTNIRLTEYYILLSNVSSK